MTIRLLLSDIKGADRLLPTEILSIKVGESKHGKSNAVIKRFFTEAIANRRDLEDSDEFLRDLAGKIDGRLKRPRRR